MANNNNINNNNSHPEYGNYDISTITNIDTNLFNECEIHEGCTVEIWKNTATGKISIGWWEGDYDDRPLLS